MVPIAVKNVSVQYKNPGSPSASTKVIKGCSEDVFSCRQSDQYRKLGEENLKDLNPCCGLKCFAGCKMGGHLNV